ncbi:ferric reduction oxidase 2 [Dorcoceras hygrometricum]|uniref:Ferric reduction oxidase 2 n=1 Tax=Dorcoceras hygrometricum TaxID=472368 RepID=A0A2Z7BTV0_9LAMI|nr:ferric reduction oxidase 2 [Dorcoceras hygrometricum]
MASYGVISAIRGAILMLALLVFLGNIMMWIIMPTDTYYDNWLLHILADTNSTYFGIQGPIMLDFTFPILFIAILGCVYLHLGKKVASTTRSCERSRELRILKRPMIVKGLGIVTLTELVLFTLFIALCVWYFSDYVRHWFRQALARSITRGEKVWQTKFDRVGIVTGVTGNLCLTFLFYPVTRGSSILPMLGLTFESSIKYHKWLGNMAMALFTLHGFIYIVYWIITHRLSEMLKWGDHYVSNIAGEICLLCGLSMWITTYPSIRRKKFELFLYTHYLYVLFIIFFILHIGIGFATIMLPSLYLFIIDRCLRFLQSKENVRLVSARVLPCETIELNFSKSRELETLSVLVKCEGNWTRKLYDLISSTTPIEHIRVSVEGPYGPATTDFLRHDMLVLISGGSGITPFFSIIRELIFISSTQKCKIPKVTLICVFKNSSNLSLLELNNSSFHKSADSCDLELRIEAYVTREKAHPKSKLESPTTISFKPNPSDAPISPALGPHSWLWLAAIISSSFIIFLILLGVFTQYAIYPIDQNTNTLYSYTKKGSMNMLFICFSIVMTASFAFLWNKKRNAMEAQQIQDTEETKASKTSTSFFEQDDVELESLPLQSITKSTNVHYGQRPDLERFLLDIKESSVGVLVSGPKKMKRDVAAICSSGMADNIYFESISFTW